MADNPLTTPVDTTATKKQPETLADIVNDPAFKALPFDMKLDRFHKATKNDMKYQKASDEGKSAVHKRVFGPGAEPSATEGAPSPLQAAGTAALDLLGKVAPGHAEALKKKFGLEQIPPQTLATPKEAAGMSPEGVLAGEYSPPGPEEPSEEKGVLSTIGGAVVKGAEQIPGLVTAAGSFVTRSAEDLGLVPEFAKMSPETRAKVETIGSKPLEQLTGEIKHPSSPGLRVLEHVVEEVVGTTISVPLARALIPALKAGTTLSKDLIKQILTTLPAATVGQGVREMGGGGGVQMAAELSTMELTQAATRVAKALANKTGMLESVRDMLKTEVPDIAEKVETSGKAKELLGSRGYEPTAPEQTGSPILGKVAAARSAEDPAGFGIPASQRSAANIKAAQEATGEMLGAAPPEVLEPIVEQAKTTVQEAAATSAASQEALAQAKSQADALQKNEILGKRALADSRSNAVLTAETKMQDVEDKMREANKQMQQEAQKAQQQGTQLDDAKIAEHRRLQDQLTQDRQAAHDEYTVAVRAADTEKEGVKAEVKATQKKQEIIIAKQTKANEDEMGTLLADVSDAAAMRAPGAVAGGEKAVRASQKERGEKAGTFFSTLWDKTFGNKEKKVEGYFGKEYGKLHETYKDLVTTPKDTSTFMNDIRPGGSFDEKMKLQMRERYEPDPLLHDIHNYVVTKAEAMGTEVDKTPLALSDFSQVRSSILADMRNTPIDSPRRIVQKQLFDLVESHMELLAEGTPALDELRGINGRYRTEMHRFVGDTPGNYATVINPRTGEPFHNPDHIGAYVAGPGATSGNLSLKGLRNEDVYRTYLSDLNDVIKGNVLKGDASALAAAKDAKARLFDSIKNEFYQETMSSGKFDIKKAEKWIQQRQSMIDETPELRRSFSSISDRLQTIADVAAVHQGQQVAESGILTKLTEEGKETISTSKLAAKALKEGAIDERTLAERTADSAFKARERTLDDVLRDQQKREQDITLQKNLQSQTGTDAVVAAKRKLLEEKRAAARSETGQVRQLEDIRMAHDEKVQLLKVKADADELHYKDMNDAYQQVFGKQGAVANALEHDSTFKQLGIGVDDWLNRTLGLPVEDQLVRFANFKKLTGSDPVATKTLMGSLWQRFVERESAGAAGEALSKRLGGNAAIAPPDVMRKFLSNEQGYGRIIKRIAPKHAENMKLIDFALQRSAELESATASGVPAAFTSIPRGVRRIQDVAVMTFAHMFGVPYNIAGVAGLTTEAAALMSNARKAAVLKELHFNPQSAKLAVDILSSTKSETWKLAVARTIVARAGAQNAVYQQEPQQ